MSIVKNGLFNNLFNEFLKARTEVEAIIVSDHDGLVIAGDKRMDIDMELLSILSTVVNPVMERFRNEFSYKKFGTANFDTEYHRILFISITETITLSLVLENLASIDLVAPYAYFLAEKVSQIINLSEGDRIDLSIPNLDYQLKRAYGFDDQTYQIGLETGGEYRFKFIIIGEHEVGKTSIIRRFVEGKFLAGYRTTIGLNVMPHNFEFFGNKISLWLWDIGAQKYFKRYRKVYYKGAQAAFIVFDLTNRQSYDNVISWYDELNEFKENDLSIVIVGNKSDLIEQRVIEFNEGNMLAEVLSESEKTKVSYIETSALNGENIREAFGIVSYHYIVLSRMLEEENLRNSILTDINSILKINNNLVLTFIMNDYSKNPALLLLTEITELGKNAVKEKKDSIVYQYSNGLTLKSFNFKSMKTSNADGIFVIFDARSSDSIDPSWNSVILEIAENIQANAVLLIGIMTSEKIHWSELMKGLEFDKALETKNIDNLIFKISSEFRLELFEQLRAMINSIKSFHN
ncbi:MAG: GTP-binding protein [Candidatus Thorarchaeota archaeon]